MHVTFPCEVPEATFASFGQTALAGDQWEGAGTDGPEFLSPRQGSLFFLPLYLSLWGKQCLHNCNISLLNSEAHILPFPLSRQREKCEDRSAARAVQMMPSPECISLLGLRVGRSCQSFSHSCMEHVQKMLACLTDAFLFSFAFIIKNK